MESVDATDSILVTVSNMHGLHDNACISYHTCTHVTGKVSLILIAHGQSVLMQVHSYLQSK